MIKHKFIVSFILMVKDFSVHFGLPAVEQKRDDARECDTRLEREKEDF